VPTVKPDSARQITPVVVSPVKPDSAIQITPVVQSADTAKTNNTTPIKQTQPTYNYPDINKNPFNPRNGDPWRYAYDGSKLLVKSPTTGNEYNLLDPNYATNYPNSKLKNPELLKNAINKIKQSYGNQLGYK
jgi:hypothetical protein